MQEVTAAILMNADKVLIARRKPGGRLENLWEFPGGKTWENETPEECLQREIKEELNIDIDVDDFFGESTYQYDHGSIRLLAYRVTWAGGKIALNDHSEVRWVPMRHLGDYAFSPADIPFVKKLMSVT